jgi:hypothetical protein
MYALRDVEIDNGVEDMNERDCLSQKSNHQRHMSYVKFSFSPFCVINSKRIVIDHLGHYSTHLMTGRYGRLFGFNFVSICLRLDRKLGNRHCLLGGSQQSWACLKFTSLS